MKRTPGFLALALPLALALLAACTPPQGTGFSGIGGEPKVRATTP
ncbi:hypothetical protein LA6_001360 [Marinibacterium anthonyi]|nr:hypothetical protein LA6_001360 [Marinibacterium anthonyi]